MTTNHVNHVYLEKSENFLEWLIDAMMREENKNKERNSKSYWKLKKVTNGRIREEIKQKCKENKKELKSKKEKIDR